MDSDHGTLEDISKCCIQMLLKEPFYAHFMMRINKVISKEIDMASILVWKKRLLQFVVNPDFWAQCSTTQRYALIKKEILQLLFKHPLTQQQFSNPLRFQLAANLMAQQYLKTEQLLQEPLLFPQVASLAKQLHIDFMPEQNIAYYAQQLEKIKTAIASSPVPEEFILIKNSFLAAFKMTESAIPWKHDVSLKTSTQKIIAYQVDFLIQQSKEQLQADYSYLPKTLIKILEAIDVRKTSKLNWRRILKIFANSSPKSYLKNTIRRPSKRYGTTPGFKIKQRQKILLAVDTSGSIQDKDALQFFQEIHQIWRRGADLFLLECDTEIQKKYPYNGLAPTMLHGRRGTNFTAAIKFANEQNHPDAIIYFTDGHGPAPDCLVRYPLLWVISSNGIRQNSPAWKALPGKKIKISD